MSVEESEIPDYNELRRQAIEEEEVITAMTRFGGGFVQQLAVLYRQADAMNREKIKTTWPEYWKHYKEMAYFTREG